MPDPGTQHNPVISTKPLPGLWTMNPARPAQVMAPSDLCQTCLGGAGKWNCSRCDGSGKAK